MDYVEIVMKEIDLYKGYEGYPEIVLEERTSNDQVIFSVRMLSFQFYEVLMKIPLGQYPEGSLMHSFLNTSGWYDDVWECAKTEDSYGQLLLIEIDPTDREYQAFEGLKEIFAATIEHGSTLYIDLV